MVEYDNANGADLTYRIPTAVREYFTPDFLGEFVEELKKRFGEVAVEFNSSIDCYQFVLYEGTNGWSDAMNAASDKFDYQWLKSYYNTLPVWSAEAFDDEFAYCLERYLRATT